MEDRAAQGGRPARRDTPDDLVVAPYSRVEVLGLKQARAALPRSAETNRGRVRPNLHPCLARPCRRQAFAIVNSIVLLASCVCLLHSP